MKFVIQFITNIPFSQFFILVVVNCLNRQLELFVQFLFFIKFPTFHFRKKKPIKKIKLKNGSTKGKGKREREYTNKSGSEKTL